MKEVILFRNYADFGFTVSASDYVKTPTIFIDGISTVYIHIEVTYNGSASTAPTLTVSAAYHAPAIGTDLPPAINDSGTLYTPTLGQDTVAISETTIDTYTPTLSAGNTVREVFSEDVAWATRMWVRIDNSDSVDINYKLTVIGIEED